MLKTKSIFRIVTISLLTVTIGLFMGACSQNDNPLNPNTDADLTGVSDLTFISKPQITPSLKKLVSDGESIQVSKGGELTINAGEDFQLIEMIKQAPYSVTAYNLGQRLLNASPLSATVLTAICENTSLRDDYWMLTVLQENTPLRKCVLDKMIEKEFVTNSWSLKNILIGSSPLPKSVLSELKCTNLTENDKSLVFAAQIGERGDESKYNNAGGGIKISLEIQPYSINQDTYISMSADDAYLMGNVYLTFAPHGILFSEPAILNFEASGLDLSGIDPKSVDIYYDNQNTGLWELMPRESITIDNEAGYINVRNAEFLHFSRYAIGMR